MRGACTGEDRGGNGFSTEQVKVATEQVKLATEQVRGRAVQSCEQEHMRGHHTYIGAGSAGSGDEASKIRDSGTSRSRNTPTRQCCLANGGQCLDRAAKDGGGSRCSDRVTLTTEINRGDRTVPFSGVFSREPKKA